MNVFKLILLILENRSRPDGVKCILEIILSQDHEAHELDLDIGNEIWIKFNLLKFNSN